MPRELRLGWLWAAVYAIAGTLCLLYLLATTGTNTLGVPSFVLAGHALASFFGAALIAYSTRGRATREPVLAACLVGAVQLLIPLAPASVGPLEALRYPLSTILLCAAGATAGAHLGRRCSEHVRGYGAAALRVVMAALVVLGAFYVHGLVVAMLGFIAHGLAVFVCLVALFATPAFAGAALQLAQRQQAESALAGGVGLIGIFFSLLLLSHVQSVALLFVFAVVFVFVGATLYGIALPGVVGVRSSSAWKQGSSEVPQAVLIRESEQPPGA